MQGKVLIVDDEPDIRELLEITLGRMSLGTESAGDLRTARYKLENHHFDLCLTDMRLPDGDGLELVEHIQQQYNRMPVAVITAHGSTETAIRAMKNGAFDFVSKPVDLQKLRYLVDSALQLSRPDVNSADEFSPRKAEQQFEIIGDSDRIKILKSQIVKLARSQAPVFISGESGSGKELAARAIHRQSARQHGPFIAVNCGAIPDELMESELFGHLKGSFTGADQDKEGLFQTAQSGTLFLDEVADLPLHMQVKLLRVLQEKSFRPVGSQKEIPVNVRILSATHKDLAHEVESGRFRQDLFYRINVIELNVPPLRERRQDIAALCRIMLGKIAEENQQPACQLAGDALDKLSRYDFPGNVRELENILQRAVALCDQQVVTADDLELTHAPTPPGQESDLETETTGRSSVVEAANNSGQQTQPANYSLEKHLENIEIEAIEKALEETRWNKTKAAKKLGMSFRSLRYRLKKLGLE
ncbi:MAG: sigma-54-dependent Fis family transcriptional regulator [Pseudomonadales bacterium]|nr:sigma-54-dependent Fis family transcriptional regulator [Pseudomonadales bacterium]